VHFIGPFIRQERTFFTQPPSPRIYYYYYGKKSERGKRLYRAPLPRRATYRYWVNWSASHAQSTWLRKWKIRNENLAEINILATNCRSTYLHSFHLQLLPKPKVMEGRQEIGPQTEDLSYTAARLCGDIPMPRPRNLTVRWHDWHGH